MQASDATSKCRDKTTWKQTHYLHNISTSKFQYWMSSLQLTNNSHHSCNWKWSTFIGLMILLSWWQWHNWKLLSRHITCQHFTLQSHVQTGAEPEVVSGGWRESGGEPQLVPGAQTLAQTLTGDSGENPKKLNTFSYLTVKFVRNFAQECSEYAEKSGGLPHLQTGGDTSLILPFGSAPIQPIVCCSDNHSHLVSHNYWNPMLIAVKLL